MAVEMFVFKVGVDVTTGKALVILADEHEQRLLPILIGPCEAQAIQIKLAGQEPIRPLTHDLLVNVVTNLGYKITDVVITHLENSIFFAEMALKGPDGTIKVDSRPSDAVAVALRAGARIWVEESVLIEAQIPYEGNEEWEQDRLRDLLKDIPLPETPDAEEPEQGEDKPNNNT